MPVAFTRYAVVVHLAFLMVYLAWGRGGVRPELYPPLIWIVLGLLEMVLLFPPARKGEDDAAARSRTLRAVLRDPILIIGALLFLFLAVQCANGPRRLVYDAVATVWSYGPPPIRWLPSCVDRGEASQVLYWFAPALAAVLAVRHGLSKRGKLLLLQILVTNGALLALIGLAQYNSGTDRLLWSIPMAGPFFASFGYLNHAGAFFTLMFIISGGLFLQVRGDEKSKRQIGWLAACLLLNLAGATLSRSRAAILLSWTTVLLGVAYGLGYLWPRLAGAAKLRALVSLLIVAGVAAFLYFVAYPGNRVQRSLATLSSPEKVRSAIVSDHGVLNSAAWRIWRNHPAYGVGAWGFRRYAGFHITSEGWERVRSAQPSVVRCDPLQLLCEHGLVGAGLVLAWVGVLLVPLVSRLRDALMRAAPARDEQAKPWLERVPPVAVASAWGVLVLGAYSLYDLPFRSPAIMVSFLAVLAAAPAFVAKVPATPVATPAAAPTAAREERGNPRRRRSQSRGKSSSHGSSSAD